MQYLLVLFFLSFVFIFQARNIQAAVAQEPVDKSRMDHLGRIVYPENRNPAQLTTFFRGTQHRLNHFVDETLKKAIEFVLDNDLDPKLLPNRKWVFGFPDPVQLSYEMVDFSNSRLYGIHTLFRVGNVHTWTNNKNKTMFIEAKLDFRDLMIKHDVLTYYDKKPIINGKAFSISECWRFKIYLMINLKNKTIKLDHVDMIYPVCVPEIDCYKGLEEAVEFYGKDFTRVIEDYLYLAVDAAIKNDVFEAIEYALKDAKISGII